MTAWEYLGASVMGILLLAIICYALFAGLTPFLRSFDRKRYDDIDQPSG